MSLIETSVRYEIETVYNSSKINLHSFWQKKKSQHNGILKINMKQMKILDIYHDTYPFI